ncbi:hypothetical protein PENSPDRAFT_754035 [Peniophora sp. CONT]|nr:hypothetical protein PENSPDRAFT_754035 [Peniophora sp. CONT]
MKEDDDNPWQQLARTRLAKRQAQESPETYRARMKRDAYYLRRALALASELHNDEAPILSLPDELIVEIFLYVRDAGPSVESEFNLKALPPSWFESVTVCRRFRRIVVNSASLHTRLSTLTHSADNIERGLSLSKNLPVTLEVHRPSQRGRLYRLIRLHGGRIRKIYLRCSAECSKALPAWVSRLRHVRSIHILMGVPPEWTVDFPEMRRVSPCLSTLHISGADIPDSDGFLFRNVTELHLIDVGLEGLPFLQGVHKLEKLVLTNITMYRTQVGEWSTMELPGSLRLLEYTGATSRHFRLLDLLSPSPAVRLKLVCTAPPNEQLYGRCKAILATWLNGALVPEAAAIRVHSNTIVLDVRMDLWRCVDDVDANRDPDVQYHFYVDYHPFTRHLLPYAEHCQKLLAFTLETDMESHCTLFGDWTHAELNRFEMPHLRHLTIRLPRSSSDWDEDMCDNMFLLYRWLHARHGLHQGPLETLDIPAHAATILDEIPFTVDVCYIPDNRGLESVVIDKTWSTWRDMVQHVNITDDSNVLTLGLAA